MKIAKAAAAVLLVVLLTWLLNTRIAGLPAIGPFINPATGFWRNAESPAPFNDLAFQAKQLHGATRIRFDQYRVPHVFAGNDFDLYFAQGFVTARDRLWQMDMQVRRAAGTLSEVMGSSMLEQDKFFRRMGLQYAAEKAITRMYKDPVIKNVIEAYTAGVNAWIEQLSPADYPVEYKLMDYRPTPWKPVYCALIMKLMAYTLSAGSEDFEMSNTLKWLGSTATKELFPDQPFLEEPVIPVHTAWDFSPQQIPRPSKEFLSGTTDMVKTDKVPGAGSNNWAVAGSKTLSGYPLLANDPHLSLSLPAIWYQVQLIAPEINVYGVSIPGVPCVIIGYNPQIAWGVTNVDADVTDWYSIHFKEGGRKEYKYGDAWKQTRERIETYKIKNGPLVTDTVYFTHHGPVFTRRDGNFALRWVAHDTSEEIKTFYLLNRSRSFNEYRQALQFFASPAQSFIYAGTDKDIALVANGKYPLRYRNQGKFILDGTDPADDWQGFIRPMEEPSVRNPERGFVSSANQPVTDSTYPYYISWRFSPSERARRINDQLRNMQKATVDSFALLQNDTYSVLAAQVLPALLGAVSDSLKQASRDFYNKIATWDYRYDAGSVGATIFDTWWIVLYETIWMDEFYKKDTLLKWPSRDRTIQLLLREKDAQWLDDRRTPQVESFTDIVNRTYKRTVEKMATEIGPMNEKWNWGNARRCSILHLGGIPSFGIQAFGANGSAETINAQSERMGPSWRMIVQLGPQAKGYGIFPGGQSGNPGSLYYDNFFQTWQEGKLNEFVFLHTENDLKQTTGTIILSK